MKINEARTLMTEGVVIGFSIVPVEDTFRHYQLLIETKQGGCRLLQTFRGEPKRFKTLDALISDIEAIQGRSIATLFYYPVPEDNSINVQKDIPLFKQVELF